MKGMQKIKRGKAFFGVVLYVLKPSSHHKQDPIVIGGNLLGYKATDLIEEFNLSNRTLLNLYGTTRYAYPRANHSHRPNGWRSLTIT